MFKNLSPEALGISGRDSEIIELVLSHGFKGLDLDLVEFAGEVKTHGLPRASRLITSAKLKIGSFRVPVRWQDDTDFKNDMEQLPALLEIAQQLGCTRATTLIEPGSDTRPYHENFEFSRRRLAELGDALGARNIRLGLGFLAPVSCRAGYHFQFMQTFDELLLLLSTIASNHVGLALDSWHWHLGGGKLEGLPALAGKIVTVALADCTPELTAQIATLEARKLPGEGGAIDFAAVLGGLAEMGYDGPLTPAPDRSQFPGQGRDKIVKSAGAALDAVWKAAGLTAFGKRAAVPGR